MGNGEPKLGLEEGTVGDSGNRKLRPVASMGGGGSEQGQMGPFLCRFHRGPREEVSLRVLQRGAVSGVDGSSASSQVDVGQYILAWGRDRAGLCEHRPAISFPSYEFMRRSLIFYRNEIQKMTGKVCMGHGKGWWWGELLGQSSCYLSITQDPLEQFGISEEARFQLSGLKA